MLNKVFFENKRIKKVQPFYKNKNLFIGSEGIRHELPKRQKHSVLLPQKTKTRTKKQKQELHETGHYSTFKASRI